MKKVLVLGHISYATPFFTKENEVHIYPETEFDGDVSDFAYVVFTGGSDINPAKYNEQRHYSVNYIDFDRDEAEFRIIKECFDKGIPTVGICRGLQLQTIMNGGKLIQHINHHDYHHPVNLITGETIQVNSLHHQLCVPKGNYVVLAWKNDVGAPLYGSPEDVLFLDRPYNEPEAIWFPETQCLGVQFHPEMMDKDTAGYKYFQSLLQTYIG